MPNRKTKGQRSGDQIDIRISALLSSPPVGYQQFTGIASGGTGVGGGGTTDPPQPQLWLQTSGTAAAAGGTLAIDFEETASVRGIMGFYDCKRTGYRETATFNLLNRSTTAAFASGLRTRLPEDTAREFEIVETVTSGKLRLTFSNGHATEALSVFVLYSMALV